MDKPVTQMTTEELCAEIEELDKVLAEKSYPRLIEELRTLAVEAAKKLRVLEANYDYMREGVVAENFHVLQTLGKALGCAPLSEFPEIYAEGEVPLDAVMTWEHTPATIAEEAARKLRDMQVRCAELEELLDFWHR